jgi:hypothetical protein
MSGELHIPAALPQRKILPFQLLGLLDPWAGLDVMRKIPAPTENQICSVQPVALCLTDYIIPAHF